MSPRLRLFAAALLATLALPAAAQPVSPLYDALRDAGASTTDATGLSAAMRAAANQTEDALLRASNAGAGDQVGYSVSLSGDRALVGAPFEDGPTDTAADAGAAYVFEFQNGVWTQTAVLRASNSQANDQFGYSVSLSGDRALVGAPFEDGPTDTAADAGAAYVFDFAGGMWTEAPIMRASNADPNDQFGWSVSLDGDRALVGAHLEDGTAPTTGNAGAAYVFEFAGGVWTQASILRASNLTGSDEFGYAVSLSGDRALVGAIKGNGEQNESGTAYIFERTVSGNPSTITWDQTALLRSIGGTVPDQFGYAVSLSGDRAFVGAPLYDGPANNTNDAGAAYVFERTVSGGNPATVTWPQTAQINSPNPGTAKRFAFSVSLSGDRALIGASQDAGPLPGVATSGTAYVFDLVGGTWTPTSTLRASNAGVGDGLGVSVSLSDNLFLVGAPFEDGPTNTASNAGAAYVFGTPTTVTQSGLYNPSSPSNGGDGYRLLGAPVRDYNVTELAGLNLVQGILAGTDPVAFPAQYPTAPGPNLYTVYNGNGTYTKPDADDVLVPGRGFFWRLYDLNITANPDPNGLYGGGTSTSYELTGFTLSASGTVFTSDVKIAFADNVGTGRDNFQMLANPFSRPLAVSGISATGGTIQGTDVVQAYNPNGRTYVPRFAGDRLAVWQGVFAELVPTAPGGAVTVTYAYASTDTNAPPTFYGKGAETGEAQPSVRFALTGALASGVAVADEAAVVRFLDGADAGWDAFDASKLTPPVAGYALLAPTTLRDGTPTRLAVDSRAPSAATTVPLAFSATDAGVFTLSWTADLPDGWTATLTDTQTGQTLDLATATEMAFTADTAQDWAERFSLAVRPAGATAGETGPAVTSLSAPFPNPATQRTALMLSLASPQHVRASVVDALGREVLVVLDGEASGAVRLDVDAARLAPGVYIVRVQGTSFAETRRLTVVR